MDKLLVLAGLTCLVVYVLLNAIAYLRLMFYWQAKEGKHMGWRDWLHIVNGDYDNGYMETRDDG